MILHIWEREGGVELNLARTVRTFSIAVFCFLGALKDRESTKSKRAIDRDR